MIQGDYWRLLETTGEYWGVLDSGFKQELEELFSGSPLVPLHFSDTETIKIGSPSASVGFSLLYPVRHLQRKQKDQESSLESGTDSTLKENFYPQERTKLLPAEGR